MFLLTHFTYSLDLKQDVMTLTTEAARISEFLHDRIELLATIPFRRTIMPKGAEWKWKSDVAQGGLKEKYVRDLSH